MKRFERALIRGWLYEPEKAARADHLAGLAITHGAGSGCESHLLQAVAAEFCSAGFYVLRFDLPYRHERPHGPPPPGSGPRDREALLAAADVMREFTPDFVILGGHSYGGRQSTIIAAEQPRAADMLLLLSYPLHPPRKPEQMRTAHLPQIAIPSLFLHGSRDPLGSIEEMRAAVALIPAPHKLVELRKPGACPGKRAQAGHELSPDLAPAILREAQCFANELKK